MSNHAGLVWFGRFQSNAAFMTRRRFQVERASLDKQRLLWFGKNVVTFSVIVIQQPLLSCLAFITEPSNRSSHRAVAMQTPVTAFIYTFPLHCDHNTVQSVQVIHGYSANSVHLHWNQINRISIPRFSQSRIIQLILDLLSDVKRTSSIGVDVRLYWCLAH